VTFNQNGIGARDLPCVRYQLVKHLDGSSGNGHVVCTLDEVGFVGEWSCCIHRDAAGEVGLVWGREEEHWALMDTVPSRDSSACASIEVSRCRYPCTSSARAGETQEFTDSSHTACVLRIVDRAASLDQDQINPA
jgi:hypothetical protein